MSIEAAFRQYLDGAATVSGAIEDRLYPVSLPRKPKYPCVRYITVSKVRDACFAGYTGLCMARIQVDVFSPSFDQAKAILDAIRVRLVGPVDVNTLSPWPGTMGTDNVEVQGIFVEGDDDGYEENDDGFDSGTSKPVAVYSSSADFLIWHKEPAPS